MTQSFPRPAVIAAAMALVFIAPVACGPADQNDEGATARGAMSEAVFPHEASDLPADPQVRYGVLENGMRYAIVENDTPTGTAALRLVFNVGSLAEDEDQRGLAHFIEHMTFNGTTHVPEGEMVPLLERYGLAFGPDTNAFTGREVVGYQLDLPSVEDQVLDVGLFLLRETASEIVFDPDAIERERGVIMGEMRTRDTPVRRFFNAYYSFLYDDTVVAERDPIGVAEVIETAGPQRFQRYYDAFYTPKRAMLVVAGDVDADAVEARIREGFPIEVPGLSVSHVESFADWTQPSDPAPDPDIGAVHATSDARFGYFHDPDVFTILTVDVLSPGEPRPDTRASRLDGLKRQLGDAILQRRLQSLINSGQSPLVQANVSFANEFDLADKAGILGVASPERWREGLAVMENELRRALEHGFTQAELDEQLANVRTRLRNAADQADTRSSPELADALWGAWLSDEVFVHPDYALSWFEEVEAEFTVAAVEAAFQEAWAAAPPHVFAALNTQIENGQAAVREAWRAASAEPVSPPEETADEPFAYTDFGAPGAVVSRDLVVDLGVTQIGFENGVRLNVKPTDFEDGVVRVRADFGAGDLTPQPTPAAGAILGAAFGGGGLEAHDRDALQRLLAGRSVGYGVGVGDDTFFFANATTPTDAELQMQVLAAFMTAPGWRADGLNQFRAIAEEVRRGQNASAVQVATSRVSRLLRNGDPRWGFPTEAEVTAFTMDDAQAFLGPALNAAPVEITIVGDITVERAVDITASTFGALPARDEAWPSYEQNADIAFPAPRADPEIVRFNGEPDQGMANTYYPAGDGFDPQRRAAMDLLESVFRLKAIDRFRERDAATYSPIVSAQLSRVFEGYGYFWVGLDVDVRDVPAMYAITDEIAVNMARGEITEDELQRARQPLLEEIEENRERNSFWLNVLARSQQDPQRLDDIRTVQARYEAVSVADLTALAGEVLRPDAAYRVSILPQGVTP